MNSKARSCSLRCVILLGPIQNSGHIQGLNTLSGYMRHDWKRRRTKNAALSQNLGKSSEENTFSIGHSALTSSLVDFCMPGNSEESNNTFILSSDGMIPHWSLLPQLDYPRLPIIRQGNNLSSDSNSCSWSLQNGSHYRPQF